MKKPIIIPLLFIMLSLWLTITGTPGFAGTDNLGMLSLDQLLDIDVISAAKVPEKNQEHPGCHLCHYPGRSAPQRDQQHPGGPAPGTGNACLPDRR